MGFFKVSIPILDLFDFMLKSMGKPPMHIRVFEDNQATIKVIRNGYSPKLRHLPRVHKVNLSSVKEVCDTEEIQLEYVETDKQASDIFTKALPPHKWQAALEMLGIRVRSTGCEQKENVPPKGGNVGKKKSVTFADSPTSNPSKV